MAESASHKTNEARFDKLCEELRTNSVGDERLYLPPYQFISDEAIRNNWVTPLSHAILHCSVISEVYLIFMKTSFSFADLTPLVPYLRSNVYIRSVRIALLSSEPLEVNLEPLLDAVGENKAIEELLVYGVKEPLSSIVNAIKAVRVLDLQGDFSLQEMDEIGKILKKNWRLHTLRLHDSYETKNVLRHLVSHPTLKSLRIVAPDRNRIRFHDALGQYVASTETLEQLKLHDFVLTKNTRVDPIFDALSANRSIVHLSLIRCRFSRGAAARLSTLPFRDAALDACTLGLAPSNVAEKPRFPASSLVSSLYTLVLCDYSNSQASHIKVVLAAMGDNASSILRLPHLHINEIDTVGIQALKGFLPKTMYLQTLTLSYQLSVIDGGSSRAPLPMSAFRRNGSLKHVSFIGQDGEPWLARGHEGDMQKIQAYCKRNTAAQDSRFASVAGSQSIPSLFGAVLPSTRTAPNTLLRAIQERCWGNFTCDPTAAS